MTKPLLIQVEDDPNDVFLFNRGFKKAEIPAELKSFEDAESLIAFLTALAADSSARLPILILLDIKLPRKSGFEVLEWIRAQPALRRIPVVMLSSSAQPHDVRRAYDMGVNGYLVKPMDVDEVVTLLTSVSNFWIKINVTATGADLPQLASAHGR